MAKMKKSFAKREDIPEGLESFYIEKDGEWVLEGVEGEEDTGALVRAKQHEKQKRQQAEQKQREAEARVTELEGQLEDLEAGDASKAELASVKRQLDKANKQLGEANASREQTESTWKKRFESRFLTSEVNAMASRLSDSPKLLSPLIAARLGIDFEGEEPSIRVRGEDGEFSEVTLADFEKSITSDPEYAPLIKGSSASGGGADRGRPGPTGKTKAPDFMTASPKEIAEWVKQNESTED